MTDIMLSQFHPKSELVVKQHCAPKPKFPVIDFHTHYGNSRKKGDFDIESDVKIFDNCGIASIINLNGFWGERLDCILGFTKKYADRFITFGGVDVAKISEPDFASYASNSIREGYKKGIRGLKFFKSLSLTDKIPADDKRLKPVWDTCAELNIPVLIHIADPAAFFRPNNGSNERFEELNNHPDWSFCSDEFFKFDELMQMQENLLGNNPNTTFVVAHVGSYSENLDFVSGQLDRHPNMNIDISARIAELGRQPYTSREFFMKYQDRILFGTDASSDYDSFPYYYRFLETWDEYFPYDNDLGQGRWHIYGIGLPDEVLKKVYYTNAVKLVPDFAEILKGRI
jgi:predicted TIM-barrel fold metal-dependent hydrolase